MKILIFGLPGSGKTTLAKQLFELLGPGTVWYNADDVRKQYDDWDFSDEGRLRQANRMRDLMEEAADDGFDVICDFVCPTNDYRALFGDDVFKIWMDTIKKSRFKDTNKLFDTPYHIGNDWGGFNYGVLAWQKDDITARRIMWALKNDQFNEQAPTTQLLGRWQPWHKGHQALFEKALEKTGQVCVMIRNMPTDKNNPFSPEEVIANLEHELAPYAGRVCFQVVPNIMHITYGRKVGYVIEQEFLGEEIEKISATKIREQRRKDNADAKTSN